MTANLTAFLQMIAVSELGQALLDDPITDRGYRCIVGSTPGNVRVFWNYRDHPRERVYLEHLRVYSTAAGKYQILAHIFDAYKASLNLPDFSPASQDAIATQLIRERRALPMIAEGDFAGAVHACSNCWASLSGSTLGQHTNQLDDLRAAYTRAGGISMGA